MPCRPSILPAVFAATLALAGAAAAQQADAPASPTLAVELNKLEDVDDICRAYFIVRNDTGAALTALELDTFLFDRDGIILQRLALPFGGAAAGRMRIVSFDLALGCETIGSLFVNDVLACESEASVDCAASLATTSRAAAGFKE